MLWQLQWAYSGIQLVDAQRYNLPLYTSVSTGDWYYVVFASDGLGNTYSYVDGVLVSASQGGAPAAITNPAFTLGAPAWAQIRNFAVWRTQLTDAEIEAEMWSETPLSHRSSLLIATDFTVSPPAQATNSLPVPTLTGTVFQMAANCTSSGGPVAPGPATVVDPSGPAAFSLIAWLNCGGYQINSCIFSNRDQNDPAHLALMIGSGGVISVEFDSGASKVVVSALNLPIPQSQWVNFAITYDGTTCKIYVNGTLAGSGPATVTASTSAAVPLLFGRIRAGATTNLFKGYLQFFSVWNIALTAAQVQAGMYSDPTQVTGCVANFSCGENPPQDLTKLNDAIWGTNILSQRYAASGWISWNGYSVAETWSAGVNRPTSSDALQLAPKPWVGKVDFRNPRPLFPLRVPTIVPFSEQHRALMLADFLRAASAIRTTKYRQRLLGRFESSLDEALAAAREGRLPPSDVNITVDGNWVIVTDATTGEVLARIEALLSPQCVAWWTGFLNDLIKGFCTALRASGGGRSSAGSWKTMA